MPGLSALDLAYLAGFTDADGHIGIRRGSCRTSKLGVTYLAHVGLTQKDTEILVYVKDHFGGYIREHQSGLGCSWRWEAKEARAIAYLRAIAPRLRLKRRQAEVCFLLADLKALPDDQKLRPQPKMEIANRWGGFNSITRYELKPEIVRGQYALYAESMALNGYEPVALELPDA